MTGYVIETANKEVHHREHISKDRKVDHKDFLIRQNDVGHCLSLSAGRYIPPHLRNKDAPKNGV